MSIRIVTDSTCDLPQEVIAEHGIAVVPLYINFGEQSFLDGVQLSRRRFYEMLPEQETPPTTAVPGTAAFVQMYEDLAAQGATEVLSIHIAASLSATYDVASKAAEQTDAVPVTVFDSTQVTLGTGLLVLAAVKAASTGKKVTQIVPLLTDMASRTHSYAALATVEFLRRSGRLTRLQYGLSTMLSIKPLIMMHDGVMSSERVRTHQGCLDRMIELVRELGPLEELALVHTNAPSRAVALHRQARDLFPEDKEPLSVEVTPVIGTHVGPGAVGLVAVRASDLV